MTAFPLASYEAARTPKSVPRDRETRGGPARVRSRRHTSRAWFVTALLAVVGATLSLWPMPPPVRTLAPHDALQALGLGDPVPYGLVMRWTPVTFKLVIGEDTAEAGGIWRGLAETAAIDKATYFRDARHARSLEERPHRFVDAVAFPIGTHQRVNRCNLTLVLDGAIASERVRCDSLVDNGLARFQFAAKLAPGVYEARLESSGNGANAVTPYVRQSSLSDERWILPVWWPARLDARSCLKTWFAFEPRQAVAYVATMLGLLGLLGLSGPTTTRQWPWFAAYGLMVLAALIVTRPFAGHDETAHVDMLYTAATGMPESAKGPFYDQARQAMLAADFFRMHPVQPQAPGQCPHMIIGTCGNSDKPLWYYSKVSAILSALGVDDWSVSATLWKGRLLNVFLLVACLGAVGVLFGANRVVALTVIAAVAGAVLSQVATVTNDFPLLIVGLFAVAWLGALVDEGRSGRTVAGGILVVGLLLLGSRIDRAWPAGLPLLLAAALYIGRRRTDSAEAHRADASGPWLTVAAFLGAVVASGAGAMTLAFSWSHLAPSLPGVLAADGDLALIRGLAHVTLSGALQALWYHLQSVFGVYVWGHSAYSPYVYGLLDAGWIACSLVGVAVSARRIPSRRTGLVIGTVLGAMLGCQLVLAVAIAQQGHASIFGLIRLSSPGIAAVMAPMYLTVLRGLERPALRAWIFRGTCAWLLVLGIYYLPLFFIGHLL